MDALPFPDEPPARDEWIARRMWFEAEEESARGQGSFLMSEHACALTLEVERAFAAGAWVATVVLAAAAQELALREAEFGGAAGSAHRLIEDAGGLEEFYWLRRRRNDLCHGNGRGGTQSDALTVDFMLGGPTELEADARRAVRAMFAAVYLSPCT